MSSNDDHERHVAGLTIDLHNAEESAFGAPTESERVRRIQRVDDLRYALDRLREWPLVALESQVLRSGRHFRNCNRIPCTDCSAYLNASRALAALEAERKAGG